MSDHVAKTRFTYDRIAAQFLENTRDRSVIARELDAFASSLPAAALVVDLGAGPAFDSAELRLRGLRAVSIDLSLGMLQVGVPEFPGPRVQADMRQLPFHSASVSGVWANACLLHLTPQEATTALREARRVLQDGGVIHLSVKLGSGSEWEVARYGQARWFQYWSAGALDTALQEAGFQVVASRLNQTSNATWLVRHARAA